MSIDLRLAATTPAGEAFVARCEKHAEDFADRAADHDRRATFPVENMTALADDGVVTAPLPTEYGGLGLTSVTDLAVGISRLARGDAATALAVCMHLGPCWSIARTYQQATLRGDTAAAERVGVLLMLIGQERHLLCGASTEPGTHTRYPLTEARRTDGGWLVSGLKIFVTNSPVATLFNVFCRARGEDGRWQAARAMIHRQSEGLELIENWDGLGMRATGSHTVRLTDVFVPDELMNVRGQWGEWSVPELVHSSAGNLAQIATYIGIAEQARDLVRETVTSRRKAPSDRLLSERHAIQTNFAKIEIAVAAARAVLDRTGRLWDSLLGRADDDIDLAEAHELMAEYQIAKQLVEQNCITAVDLAMLVSGGSGYFNTSPLSRLYRDVRAGPFMQPFSPLELFEYIGKVRLGVAPDVEL